MNSYSIRIEVPEGKVKEILDRMTEAQETIQRCLWELSDIGVLTIAEKNKADSGN